MSATMKLHRAPAGSVARYADNGVRLTFLLPNNGASRTWVHRNYRWWLSKVGRQDARNGIFGSMVNVGWNEVPA